MLYFISINQFILKREKLDFRHGVVMELCRSVFSSKSEKINKHTKILDRNKWYWISTKLIKNEIVAFKNFSNVNTIREVIKDLEKKSFIKTQIMKEGKMQKLYLMQGSRFDEFFKFVELDNPSPSPSSDLGPKPVSPDDRAMRLPKTGNEAGAKRPASAPSRPRDQHSHQVPETPYPIAKTTRPASSRIISDTLLGSTEGKSSTPASRRKPHKKTYGEYKNVRLTEAEHAKLREKYGEEAEDFIEWYSAKKESKGYRYASDSAVFDWWGFDGYEKQKHWQASKKAGRSKRDEQEIEAKLWGSAN